VVRQNEARYSIHEHQWHAVEALSLYEAHTVPILLQERQQRTNRHEQDGFMAMPLGLVSIRQIGSFSHDSTGAMSSTANTQLKIDIEPSPARVKPAQ
jgi:hypothetical protein